MHTTWVLVANSSKARLFVRNKVSSELALSGEYQHPESRQKGSELASDRPGHAQSKGAGRGAMVASSDPKEYEAERFARELAEMLNTGRNNNDYDDIVLVAPSHFTGLLNKHLDKHVKDLALMDIHKDYTAETELALGEKLTQNLKTSV